MLGRQARGIEAYPRGLKQCCGIERAQVRSSCGQREHFLAVVRACLRLEGHRLQTGVSWHEAKLRIIRDAVRAYLPTLCTPCLQRRNS